MYNTLYADIVLYPPASSLQVAPPLPVAMAGPAGPMPGVERCGSTDGSMVCPCGFSDVPRFFLSFWKQHVCWDVSCIGKHW